MQSHAEERDREVRDIHLKVASNMSQRKPITSVTFPERREVFMSQIISKRSESEKAVLVTIVVATTFVLTNVSLQKFHSVIMTCFKGHK